MARARRAGAPAAAFCAPVGPRALPAPKQGGRGPAARAARWGLHGGVGAGASGAGVPGGGGGARGRRPRLGTHGTWRGLPLPVAGPCARHRPSWGGQLSTSSGGVMWLPACLRWSRGHNKALDRPKPRIPNRPLAAAPKRERAPTRQPRPPTQRQQRGRLACDGSCLPLGLAKPCAGALDIHIMIYKRCVCCLPQRHST